MVYATAIAELALVAVVVSKLVQVRRSYRARSSGGTDVHGALPRRTPGYLNTVMLGAPNRRIELTQAISVQGPYGISRSARTIDLSLDDPGGFDAAIRISWSVAAGLPSGLNSSR